MTYNVLNGTLSNQV